MLQQVDWHWLTNVVHVLDARDQWKHDLSVVCPAVHVDIVVVHCIDNIAALGFSILNATISTILIHLLVSIEVKGHSGRSMVQSVVLLVFQLVILLRQQTVNRMRIENFAS